MTALPEAMTDAGAVRGLWRQHRSADGSVSRHAIFLGIPFAAPPVGDARFDAPRPADALTGDAWAGVRECFGFGATSQRRSPWDPPRIPEPSIWGPSVLNANVTTPDPTPGAGLPVLVWIHGGGFNSGSPASPWYGGQAFARDGVVTVALSYRVGFEGFGWIDGAVNNRGVLDWLAGLEWVQRNIAAFGGDPARVTIGGQSAGGAAVMRLLTMTTAQHLFASVLAISPADASASVDQARAAAARIADAVGSPLTRAALEAVPELAFFDAREAAFEQVDDDLTRFITRNAQPLALGPVVDGEVCETSVTDALAAGVGASKPLYIGACAHEFNDLTAWCEDEIGATPAADLLERAGVPAGLAIELADDALPSTPEGRSPAAWALGQAMSDAIFRQVVAHWAPLRAASGAPTWVYDFRWESRAPGVNGAAHCVDVPFGFDILNAPRVDAATGPAPQSLADAVHGDWLAIVREGAVDAPQWGADRGAIVYGADGTRSIGTGYAREARLWEATRT
jgi:para-nitrobenzyl esterase